MKKALVIGIDDYAPPYELYGCVNDAVEIAALLESNGDGAPNFDVRRVISSEVAVNVDILDEAIKELFIGDADVALLFFAGHGLLDVETNSGFLMTQDFRSLRPRLIRALSQQLFYWIAASQVLQVKYPGSIKQATFHL
jgi:hypothetical protein